MSMLGSKQIIARQRPYNDSLLTASDGPDDLRTAVLVELDEAVKPVNPFLAASDMRAPVLKLPTELFIYIVFILQDIWKAKRGDALGWLNMTFVCPYWRTTALEAALLWTNVDLYLGAQWAIAFLDRAKHMPVSLTILTEAEQGEPGDTVTALIAHYTGRSWPSLCAISFRWELQGFRISELPTSVYSSTSLQSLALHNNHLYENDDQKLDFWDMLPSTLLELELVGSLYETLGPVALEGLTPFLARSSNLKAFTISTAYLENLSISSPIGLPALRYLSIMATSDDCLRLVEAIDHPDDILTFALQTGSDFEVPELEAIFRYTHPSSTTTSKERYSTIAFGQMLDNCECGSKYKKTIAACRASDPTGVIQEVFEEGSMLGSPQARDITAADSLRRR
ncbi:hypothetical protein PENSPDRAFT_160846 [Peniophora sp. CONT]|nr:hypothetical protein PENSPDRAFT_160846 [Peniophora sp. CONT]